MRRWQKKWNLVNHTLFESRTFSCFIVCLTYSKQQKPAETNEWKINLVRGHTETSNLNSNCERRSWVSSKTDEILIFFCWTKKRLKLTQKKYCILISVFQSLNLNSNGHEGNLFKHLLIVRWIITWIMFLDNANEDVLEEEKKMIREKGGGMRGSVWKTK